MRQITDGLPIKSRDAADKRGGVAALKPVEGESLRYGVCSFISSEATKSPDVVGTPPEPQPPLCSECGEPFERRSWHQVRHSQSQNQWCNQQYEIRRASIRRSKSARVTPKARVVQKVQIAKPIAVAVRLACRRYRWLYQLYREDVEQELAVVLTTLGITEMEKPVLVDFVLLSREVSTALRRFAKDMGFGWDESGNVTKRIEVELPSEFTKLSQWQAAWRAA